MRKQYKQACVYGTKHVKSNYLNQKEAVQCKQPQELSVICS